MLFFRTYKESRWVAAGLAVILITYLAHAFYFRHYVNDDAYVTFRYSSFLAAGHGPYFNVGEHVEGYTNLLLMLLLAPVSALGGDAAVPLAAKAIGIICGYAAVLMAFMLARSLDRGAEAGSSRPDICGLVAAGIVAVSPAFALNSVSGLETTLFAAAIITGLTLGASSPQGRRWWGVGLAFSAGVLTRPEGILIFAAYWSAQVLLTLRTRSALAPSGVSADACGGPGETRPRRYWFRVGVVVAIVFVGQLVFRLIAYDGEWLPNTFYAKKGGFWEIDAWDYIADGIMTPCLGLIGTLVGCIGWFATRSRGRAVIPIATVAVTGTLLPFVTGTDWMLGGRLVMPYLPIVAAVIAVGWCRVAGLLFKKSVRLGPALVLCALPVLWFTQGRSRAGYNERSTIRARGYVRGHTALANWLRSEAADPGDVIALMDIGIVGYLCSEQRIQDISGLTDRVIARSPGPFLDKDYNVDYILYRQPEFIVLVMTGKPDDDKPSSEDLGLKPWTRVERSIWEHPDFQRYYVRKASPPVGAPDTTRGIASRLGAERVFQHDYPGRYYLLAVFRSQ